MLFLKGANFPCNLWEMESVLQSLLHLVYPGSEAQRFQLKTQPSELSQVILSQLAWPRQLCWDPGWWSGCGFLCWPHVSLTLVQCGPFTCVSSLTVLCSSLRKDNASFSRLEILLYCCLSRISYLDLHATEKGEESHQKMHWFHQLKPKDIQ